MIIEYSDLSYYINNLKIEEETEDGDATITGDFLVLLEEVTDCIGAFIEEYEELPVKATLKGVRLQNENGVEYFVDETTLFQKDFKTKSINKKTYIVFNPTTAY